MIFQVGDSDAEIIGVVLEHDYHYSNRNFVGVEKCDCENCANSVAIFQLNVATRMMLDPSFLQMD